MKKLITLATVIITTLMSGCTSLESLTPRSHIINPGIKPILPFKKTDSGFYLTPQDEINRLARDATNSTEIYFPQGRVIPLRREKEIEGNRYLVLEVIIDSEYKDLRTTIFTGEDETIETEIKKELSNNKHGLAIKTLYKSGHFTRASIYNPRIFESTGIDYILRKEGITLTGVNEERLTNTLLNILEKVDSSKIKTNYNTPQQTP